MADIDIWDIVHYWRRRVRELSPSLERLSAPEREARMFTYALLDLPTGMDPRESLAGDFGPQYLAREDYESLASDIAAQSATPSEPSPPTPADLMRGTFNCFGAYTAAHTCPDYERVVKEGITGILAEVRECQATATEEQLRNLRGMETALQAVIFWMSSHCRAIRKLLRSTTDPEARRNLERAFDACTHVPEHPARSFHEALQAIWFVHAAIGISELSDASLSLGRLDQYLYPLYQADRERGVPEADLERFLHDFFLKLNRFGDPACTINLGGVDGQGRDLFNPLSGLILRVTGEMHLPSPLLAARIHRDLPPAVFDRYLAPELLTMGQPTFYGEDACREAMIRRGVPEAEAHRFALNSCMGIVMPGEEISDMWGGVANLLLPLELALNTGQPFAHELPIPLKTPARTDYATCDELFEQFALYLGEIVGFCIEQNALSTAWVAENQPNPFLSALTKDCIQRGLDRAGGGARYHSVIIEGFGWANAADALTAIRRLVFRDKRYTLAQMVEAAKANYDGFEDLQQDILHCPKYGNADAEADEMARRVTEAFVGAVTAPYPPAPLPCREGGTATAPPRPASQGTPPVPGGETAGGCGRGGVQYLPSYHTLNAHIGAGAMLPASLDGRRAGEPLNKNAGPMLGRANQGLTGVMLSATAFDQRDLGGGQALDISIPAHESLSQSDDRRKFAALPQTYFDRGGLEVQVNGLTAADLRAAIANPQDYADLTVKIAGYSARFVRLSPEVQAEMVERFERQL